MILKLKNTNFTNIKYIFCQIIQIFFEIVAANKIFLGKNDFKYSIDYKDAPEVRPCLCIFLQKMSACRRDLIKVKVCFL